MERLISPNKLVLSFPLEQIQPIILKRDRFVLLETQRVDRDNYLSYLFLDPVVILTSSNLDTISKVFQRLEIFLDKGYWAAGFFSYEMGYVWEPHGTKRKFSFPLIWMGIFKPPLIFNHLQGRFLSPLSTPLTRNKTLSFKDSGQNFGYGGKYEIKEIRLNEILPTYVRNLQRIKNYIAQGFTYQVNYTIKCKFKFQDSIFALYQNLRNAQPVPYSALIKDRQLGILSFSPELFFRKQGRLITVRPMKGTISRGRTAREDRLQIQNLRNSLKDRSENVMIVDLLRNDLGKVSDVGSVRTVKLYTVEKYKTLFQMTSTIQARLKEELSLYELFKSIFPSGSVTGAPKIKTMDIIRQLEKEERRVYTGAIGFFKPDRDAVFNVAIRTVMLRGNLGEMGIGSGIVYDSEPEREYKECELKALFFTQKRNKFQLIETMRWSKKTGFFLLSYHLARLKSSAEYFNFIFNEELIRQRLEKLARCLNPAFSYRVRLLLSSQGEVGVSYRMIREGENKDEQMITFASKKTNSQDVSLYHKTTSRQLYDQEYQKAKTAGFFEVIFENERDEITEGAISNIFIRKAKIYYTPPISCGLLNGVYRQHFMKRKSSFAKERILKRQDLYQADAIYVCNSVRGLTRVRLI
jgi:para-aminobenzoate synthetase/4-amino-4-deoxychorismate lyase